MIIKIISLFLIAMLVLALFGRLRLPRRKRTGVPKPARCPRCGSYIIGKGPCPCDRG